MTGDRNPAAHLGASRVLSAILVVCWIGAVVVVARGGADYYKTPLQERPFSQLHDLYKPSGNVGHGLGIVGSVLIVVGVNLYSLRKHLGWLAGVGRLSTWLNIHIFMCTLGPALVLFHTTFKFGGIVSIAFWSMTVVVLSGVFGRYLYGKIPKTIQGQFRTLDSIRQQRAELAKRLTESLGLDREQTSTLFLSKERPRPNGFLHALAIALGHDFKRRVQKKRIRKALSAIPGSGKRMERGDRELVTQLMLAQMNLEQQIVLLEPFQRVFGYWHLLHIPLAGVMFLILFVHIAVSVIFGYTWVF